MEICQKSRSSAFSGHLQVQEEGDTGPPKTCLGRGRRAHSQPALRPGPCVLGSELLPFRLGLSSQNQQCLSQENWDWARGHAAG